MCQRPSDRGFSREHVQSCSRGIHPESVDIDTVPAARFVKVHYRTCGRHCTIPAVKLVVKVLIIVPEDDIIPTVRSVVKVFIIVPEGDIIQYRQFKIIVNVLALGQLCQWLQ